jgi:hypothetical protein
MAACQGSAGERGFLGFCGGKGLLKGGLYGLGSSVEGLRKLGSRGVPLGGLGLSGGVLGFRGGLGCGKRVAV